jgi:hypothetical protein
MTNSFRILDQAPVYFDLLGQIAAGGSLNFYAAGTTTPQSVYGDPALTVNNGAVIAIGTDGRAVDDIWGNGTTPYRVRLYAANGTLIADRDNVQIAGSGSLTIPTLVPNEFLTNDGANLIWQAIRQAPDPTGQAGKILGSDGTNAIWQTIASLNIPTITTTANSLVLAGIRFQWGSGTFPASGSWFTQQNVTFPVAFSSVPYHVNVNPTGQTPTAIEGVLIPNAININAAGFAAYADTNFGAVPNSHMIINAIPYTWFALGPA